MGPITALLALTVLVSPSRVQDRPYDRDIAEFRKLDAARRPEKGQILFIGSSSFTRWARLQDAFPGRRVLNRAFGGSTLLDVRARLEDVVFPYQPGQIVLYCGENDFAADNGLAPDAVVGRLIDLFRTVRARLGAVPFVYVSMKPSPSRWHLAPKFRSANDGIRAFLGKQSKTVYVDVWPVMLGKDGRPREELFVDDKLHMNDKGYALWTPLLDKVLVRPVRATDRSKRDGPGEVPWWTGGRPTARS
ncbi:MAG: G-D-S-L family lipolytic protein [Armatimonadetes bacterium]|nr:G-D-S-L family lipolytic protein [Armatimonadota bacterium]